MRLDKFLAENTGMTRSQANKILSKSAVTINGNIEKKGSTQITLNDEIYLEGKRLVQIKSGLYIMLNKPEGCVCSHDDTKPPYNLQFI